MYIRLDLDNNYITLKLNKMTDLIIMMLAALLALTPYILVEVIDFVKKIFK